MPKLLIIETCLVNYGDDRGGVAEEIGAKVDVNKDMARALVNMGRALFIKKEDDFDKAGRNTAPAVMLRAAEKDSQAAAKSDTKEPA